MSHRKSKEVAWNLTSVDLVRASEVSGGSPHCAPLPLPECQGHCALLPLPDAWGTVLRCPFLSALVTVVAIFFR